MMVNRTNAMEWGGIEDEFEGIVEVRKSKNENSGAGRYGKSG